MIKNYFEKKKFSLKALSDVIHRNYSSFLGQIKRDTVSFKDIAILYNNGVLNREDIDIMIKLYK